MEILFAAALERRAAERKAFLAAACPDDPGLCREVAGLLAADGAAEPLLARTVGEAARSLAAGGSLVGRRVGAWRLVREIGRGGMAQVFLALRADRAFEQRVAVKLLLPGFESGDLLRRFLHERQVLARLAHPYIAALLDGGTTEDGRPWFVLEHVEGEAIDAWCDQRRLPVEERLRLFLKVCEAVHAAHRSLVVHRDLKPSNVLVNGEGVPKLLDFGIAKPLGPRALAGEELTRTGTRPLTPHYASPEQLRGEPVTTASDVYSLGVLLHRLLTGRLPHRRAGRTAAEWERVVLEEEAGRASLAPGRAEDGPGAEEVAALRASTPEALRRRLAGDLETVLAKAVDRDPERRYGSVLQLAEDVSRHLDGLPVIARPPTLRYRVGKFLARHRVAASLAALALAAILLAVVVLGLQARRIAHERDRANQVAELLVELFSVADPREAQGGSIPARELLDRGAERVAALEGQPETRSMLLGKLAELYEPLGLYDQAAGLLSEAVALERSRFDGPRRVPWRRGAGRQLASHLNHLGRVRARQGDYAAAEPLFTEALARFEASSGAESRDAARVLNNLALVRHDLGDYDAAAEVYRRSLELERRLDGGAHSITVANYGLLLVDLGHYAAAEDLLRPLVEEERRAGVDDHALASALGHLGLSQLGAGRWDAAEASLREARGLHRTLVGDRHPDTARSTAALGVLLRERGDLVAAEELLTASLEVRRRVLGEDHPEVADGLRERAALRALQGRREEAEADFREALAIQRRSLVPGHPLTGLTLAGLGTSLAAAGECAAALPLLDRALERVPERDWRRPPVAAARERCR